MPNSLALNNGFRVRDFWSPEAFEVGTLCLPYEPESKLFRGGDYINIGDYYRDS